MRNPVIALTVLALMLAVTPVCAQQQPSQPPTRDEEVTVTGPRKALDLRIHDYVTTYAAPSPIGRVARWDEPICPRVIGLPEPDAQALIDRLQKIAKDAGVRFDQKPSCRPNMMVAFTNQPQDLVNGLREKNPSLLGYHFEAETDAIAAFTHPIQAWYVTATRDHDGVAHPDDANFACTGPANAVALAPSPDSSGSSGKSGGGPGKAALALPNPAEPPGDVDVMCKSRNADASRIRDDVSSIFQVVTVIVDQTKITGTDTGAVTDYIAMLALSQTAAFDSCSVLPSIRNLFASACDPAARIKELSENDKAYLHALYAVSPGMVGSAQRSTIQASMLKTLAH